MGKKGLVSIFSRLVDSSSPTASPATPPWPWPPCGTNPQTVSFRAGDNGEEPCCATTTTTAATGATRCPPAATTTGNKLMAAPGEMYKTVNSVYYLDDSAAADVVDLFSLAGDEVEEDEGEVLDDDLDSFSTTTASEEWSEAVIRSLGRTSTDRFFFDPGPFPASNSILATSIPSPATLATPKAEAETETPPPEPDDDDEAKACGAPKSLAEGSVPVAVDSGDPYGDFRASMEEMVTAHGLRDWAALEELLAWYLRINGKQHHHVIVGAFVDLLLGLASSSPSDTTATATSTSSSSGSRCTTSTSTSTAATTTSSAAGDTATATATNTAAAEECGGANEATACCCSSSSSSCAAGADVQDDVAEEGEEEKASSAAASGDDRASAPLRVP